MKYFYLTIFTLSILLHADLKQDKERYRQGKKLTSLHTKISEPELGDWLAEHEEEGQTFHQYLSIKPIKSTKHKNTIYIQPLGTLTKQHKEVIKITAEVMQAWFGLPVNTRKTISLKNIPNSAKRNNPYSGQKQYLSTYLLHDVLYKEIPNNAACYLGIITTDLWPRPGWNFVFGQASLSKRVGVWSLARYGEMDKENGTFTRFLRRTIKTAVHETGHMFSIKHCTLYECLMCGSNSMEESDARPLKLCPQCLPKVSHATGVKIVDRFIELKKIYDKYELNAEALYCQQALELLRTEQTTK